MRFVATLLGLRAHEMKTGAPAYFHLRCAMVKTSHTPEKENMMIKPEKYSDYAISQFYLLENNETGLLKAFAYPICQHSCRVNKIVDFIFYY